MKWHLFYVLMDRTSPIHECEKCLNTNAKSVFQPNSVRSEGCKTCTSVLQEITYKFEWSANVRFSVVCGPFSLFFHQNYLVVCVLKYQNPTQNRHFKKRFYYASYSNTASVKDAVLLFSYQSLSLRSSSIWNLLNACTSTHFFVTNV